KRGSTSEEREDHCAARRNDAPIAAQESKDEKNRAACEERCGGDHERAVRNEPQARRRDRSEHARLSCSKTKTRDDDAEEHGDDVRGTEVNVRSVASEHCEGMDGVRKPDRHVGRARCKGIRARWNAQHAEQRKERHRVERLNAKEMPTWS